MTAIIFDLDQTLIDSQIAEQFRRVRNWPKVYSLIPKMIPYDGVAAMIAMLKERDVPTAIVTSSPGPYCSKVLVHHKFDIEKTVCFHDTSNRKPHPDPILKAVELLGVPADTVWSIGDDVKDIQASLAAGVHSLGIAWGNNDVDGLIAAGPEQMFQTVAELHAFLDELTKPS